MLQATEKVDGPMLWASLHPLFRPSLIPFTTGWMGENHLAIAPSALYGAALLMAAFAHWPPQQRIVASQGRESRLRRAIGGDWKGKLSPLLHVLGMLAAFWAHRIAQGICVLVALLWLMPERRIERTPAALRA